MIKWAPQIAVVAVLVAIALALPDREAPPSETPEAAVSAFFDTAGRGDIDAYLAMTGDALRRSLENTREKLGDKAFRGDLERSAAGIKGIAVTRRSDAPEGCVALDVELVFVDRNERQKVLLEKRGSGWVVKSLGAVRSFKPPIPYGTPVFGE